MKKEDVGNLLMSTSGKLNIILSVSIALVFLFSITIALGEIGIKSHFPITTTNASASFGYADGSLANMAAFNGTNGQFRCNVTVNSTANFNITNVSLYIGTSAGTVDSVQKNQTQWLNQSSTAPIIVIFNATTFAEGTYFWFCEAFQNSSADPEAVQRNFTSTNRTFIIDYTPPGFVNLTNTSNAAVASENTVYLSAAFKDALTFVHTVRLFVNISGSNYEVNITTDGAKGAGSAGNNTRVNLSFKIPGSVVGQVLNFTLQANDSVNNLNITSAVIFLIEGDGTVPGPITLNSPAVSFNQSSATAPNFNFTAIDNNDTSLDCYINLSLGNSPFTSITGIRATNGTPQINTTSVSLSNGTYTWNATCSDTPGNSNISVSRIFTVDQIPPVINNFTITNGTNYDNLTGLGSMVGPGSVPATGVGTWAQNRKLTAFGRVVDNLTRPSDAVLQFYNVTSSSWQTLNSTTNSNSRGILPSVTSTNGTVNLTFTPPLGHNEFEGRNVTFRLLVNDTLGNVNSSGSLVNITVQFNDTTVPEVNINGTIIVNNTNTTNIVPIISWYITEYNKLTSINVSVDGIARAGTGVDSCKKSAFYDTSAGDDNVESHRNDSFQVSSVAGCPLANGTHWIRVIAIDSWGNTVGYLHNFTVQSGSVPALKFNAVTGSTGAANSVSAAINNTNITSKLGLNFSATIGQTGQLQSITYVSSCDSSSTITFTNSTAIFPFNASTCATTSGTRTLTVTVTDSAGNSNSTAFGFTVDNTAPPLVVHAPTQNFRGGNEIAINLSAVDNTQRISFFGYYLDNGSAFRRLNDSSNAFFATSNFTFFNTTNFTAGTHTIKFFVNDTLGNHVNSSVITFTVEGSTSFAALKLNTTLLQALDNTKTVLVNLTNSSGGPVYESTGNFTDQNLNLIMVCNGSSSKLVNVTITFNASAANWDRYNFSIYQNNTLVRNGISNNQTLKIFDIISVDTNISNFLPDSGYYGIVKFPVNVTAMGIGRNLKLQYYENFEILRDAVNITECSSSFAPSLTGTSGMPCWNLSTRGSATDIFVPHFSHVVLANDSVPPTIINITPSTVQTVVSFVPNITVSDDAKNCSYSYNASGAQSSLITMTLNEQATESTCIGSRITNLTNGTTAVNITFYVYDTSENLNQSSFMFSVNDTTRHTAGVTIGSITSGAATISVTANESVNMSVNTTGSSSFTNPTPASTFSTSQSISLSGLTASTTYNLTVLTCDRAGNCLLNTTLGFTTSAAAAASTTTTSTSSSSSGGGVVTSNVEASAARAWDNLGAGTTAVFTITNERIAVIGVVLDVKNDVTSPSLTVESLLSNPQLSLPSGKVFQYLQITKGNIADTDTSKITIKFKVSKTWLATNGVSENDIVLYRYTNGNWEELATVTTGADANNVLYESTTPGFSTFAVGVKSSVAPVPEPVPVPTETPVPPPETVPTTEPAPVEAPTAPEAGTSNTLIAWIVVLLIVVVAAVGYYMWQKKKSE